MLPLEIPKPQTELTIPYARFLGESEPARIRKNIKLDITEHTYLPKTQNPREDWVASVAVPAFQALHQTNKNLDSFATIGTGAGLDALAAIEILNPKTVMITDIHEDVLAAARRNVARNVSTDHQIELLANAGELAQPLIASGRKYDVVYENLPNIPLPEGKSLDDGTASASFVPHDLNTGAVAKHYLLELHGQLLSQAKDFLNPGGQVLSSIGGRIPLQAMLWMAQEAGCESEILTYTWKIQSEAEEVIRGYAEAETKDKGPFYFYPVERVKEVFAQYASPADAAKHAFAIEHELEVDRLTSAQALQYVSKGGKIAHTAAVIASKPAIEVK